MTAIVTIVAATLVSLFAVMAATSWFMHRLMQSYIGSRHLLLEEIIRTEKVPKRWSLPYERKAAKQNGRKDGKEEAAKLAETAKRSYIGKLDRLANYVRKTRLVEDEETRQTLLADLERIRKLWRESRGHEQRA